MKKTRNHCQDFATADRRCWMHRRSCRDDDM